MPRKCCSHCPRRSSGSVSLAHPITSCIERFVTAKKFHAENLQHQPLPDRVDDAIFSASVRAEDPYMCEAVKRCQRIVPRRQPGRRKDLPRSSHYGPALGCKRPTTYMDLAICWETPPDPAYEPRRAPHIDGSDGGPAPAVFTLVQQPEPKVDVHNGSIPGLEKGDEEHEETEATRNRCCQDCDKCLKDRGKADSEAKEVMLCKSLDSMNLTDERSNASKTRRANSQRHCLGCPQLSKAEAPARTTRSALCPRKPVKSNGLPSRLQVPRPRTPYARRTFCIDSLAPPFSVVAGCRDTDYPEHWRLTSIYRQSYRNPKKMRETRTLLKYDRT
ncbi:PREDICTED: uncharacterized protein LOC105362929 [Ceratosolen solmsi marchali]|uniref:Uncharacterized protein LOC105362929 n=1 Tax=Ceratosolen solmsi marchali TaxID=326594 RepID=A0AAJ6YIN5_9HYME|nr:PREDICTED: uncharacterized protein LOC105362929 [Ceratosolen solmsi marchali]